MRNEHALRSSSTGTNQLINALSPESRERLAPHLELVQLPAGDVLYDCDQTASHAYFPISAVVSLLHVLEDGASTEFALVGNDGMLGVALLMGGGTMPNQALVQRAGYAYRLPADILRQEFNHDVETSQLFLRYVQYLLTQVSQVAVCNRHHTIRQQLSRWLLVYMDRLPGNNFSHAIELKATHESIANMLGVRRESVSEAASILRKQKLITYSRGRLSVADRQGLEATACECYALMKQEYKRLLSSEHSANSPHSTNGHHPVKKQDFSRPACVGLHNHLLPKDKDKRCVADRY